MVPRYVGGGGANPSWSCPGWPLVADASGDRGLGPILAAHPALVAEVDLGGSNPDVDTPADLAELAWADRVRRNRDQVDRHREVPDGPDFYGPVSSLFRADPRRTDEPLLQALLALAKPDGVWLDIGAGAGRYALPLALRVREVVAVEPSDGMRAALAELMAEHGIANIRVVADRWPAEPGSPAAGLRADVALIAHLGYDIEAIGPFVDAMEAAARQRCAAVLMDRQPTSIADPFWPPIHGEARVTLPALPEFVDLLRARGRHPEVTMFDRPPRGFDSFDELHGFVRRQLWLAEDGRQDRRLRTMVEETALEDRGRWLVRAAREPSMADGGRACVTPDGPDRHVDASTTRAYSRATTPRASPEPAAVFSYCRIRRPPRVVDQPARHAPVAACRCTQGGRGGRMIPGQFEYVRPTGLDDALRILSEREGEAKVLSGGYSLLPLLKLRLAQPGLLVDIRDVDGLDGIVETDDGLRIGGRATHRQIHEDPAVRAGYPLLTDAAGGIGDPQIRNWGTIGGSCAHADPSADWPAVLLAGRATIVVPGSPEASARWPPAASSSTPSRRRSSRRAPDRGPHPRARPGQRQAYAKLERRAGDFSTVGVRRDQPGHRRTHHRRRRHRPDRGGRQPVRRRPGRAALIGATPSEATFRTAGAGGPAESNPARRPRTGRLQAGDGRRDDRPGTAQRRRARTGTPEERTQ